MAVFESCCCFRLRSGVVIIAVVMLGLSVLLLSGCIVLLCHEVPLETFLQKAWQKLYFGNGPLVVPGNSTIGPLPLPLSKGDLLLVEFCILMGAVLMSCCCVVNVLLIVGAITDRPFLMIPWMAIQWLSVLLAISALGVALWRLISSGVVLRYWWATTFGVAVVVVLLLLLVVVLSLHQALRHREIPDDAADVELINRYIWTPKDYSYYS